MRAFFHFFFRISKRNSIILIALIMTATKREYSTNQTGPQGQTNEKIYPYPVVNKFPARSAVAHVNPFRRSLAKMNEDPLRNIARISNANKGGAERAASTSYRKSMLSLKRHASQIPTTTASIKLAVSKRPCTVSSSYFDTMPIRLSA